MHKRLEKEIDKLKRYLLSLSAVVEERVRLSVKSIDERDLTLAEKIIEGDLEIDQMEVDLEEECLKILALYQPVAVDLRFIIAVLKINNDLERIGDLAVNIAQRAVTLTKEKKIDIPFDFPTMSGLVQAMLRNSLDSFINMDMGLAYEVCKADDKVDKIHSSMYKMVEEAIIKNPNDIESMIQYLGVSRYLERVADHATNIAEDVIYLVQGEIIRHKRKERKNED